MEHVLVPEAGFPVPRVALGTWAIGGWMWGGTNEKDSVAAILAAIDRGVTLIDTAPVYGFGRSEEIVGKALARHGRRDEVRLSTKAGLEWTADGRVRRNATPERLRVELDDSLRRLGTDVIDVYFVHWPDPLVPFAETAAAMRGFLEAGKIRAIGVSNFAPEQMEAFCRVAPIHFCQPPYNLFERGIEADVKPYCERNGIALMTYGTLCRGLLSGRMSADRVFEGDDLRKADPKFREPRFGQYLAAADRLAALARERHDKSLLAFAVRWVLDMGAHTALWGARRPGQLDPVDEAMGWEIDAESLAEADRIVREAVADPVGPEFMAPPSREADQPDASVIA